MRSIIAVVTVALVGLAAAPTAQQPARTPEALARALQDRYDRVTDFTADFAQTYRGGALRTQSREQGKVVIKKPGRMRWTYAAPEKKEIVSDGTKLYMYFPQDRRVMISDVPEGDSASTGAMFLAGRGDVSRDFTAAAAPAPEPGLTALKLTPRRQQPDYEYLVVTLDPATLQIRGLLTHDRIGGDSTLTFTNLKENKGISDKEFVFHIPNGVRIDANGTRN